MSKNTTVNSRFFVNGIRKEIDLRQELSNTLFGSGVEIEKGYKFLVRRMRLVNGQKVRCHCNSGGEGAKHPMCNNCHGEGYIWDEVEATGFRSETGSESAKTRRLDLIDGGSIKPSLISIYVPHTIDIRPIDRIVEYDVDGNGESILTQRGRVWEIQTVEEKRSDNGRLEYYVIYCSKISHIYLNGDRRGK
jgi:hypothetical protein